MSSPSPDDRDGLILSVSLHALLLLIAAFGMSVDVDPTPEPPVKLVELEMMDFTPSVPVTVGPPQRARAGDPAPPRQSVEPPRPAPPRRDARPASAAHARHAAASRPAPASPDDTPTRARRAPARPRRLASPNRTRRPRQQLDPTRGTGTSEGTSSRSGTNDGPGSGSGGDRGRRGSASTWGNRTHSCTTITLTEASASMFGSISYTITYAPNGSFVSARPVNAQRHARPRRAAPAVVVSRQPPACTGDAEEPVGSRDLQLQGVELTRSRRARAANAASSRTAPASARVTSPTGDPRAAEGVGESVERRKRDRVLVREQADRLPGLRPELGLEALQSLEVVEPPRVRACPGEERPDHDRWHRRAGGRPRGQGRQPERRPRRAVVGDRAHGRIQETSGGAIRRLGALDDPLDQPPPFSPAPVRGARRRRPGRHPARSVPRQTRADRRAGEERAGRSGSGAWGGRARACQWPRHRRSPGCCAAASGVHSSTRTPLLAARRICARIDDFVSTISSHARGSQTGWDPTTSPACRSNSAVSSGSAPNQIARAALGPRQLVEPGDGGRE